MHDTNLLEDQPIAWTPSPEVIEQAQLTKFMRQVGVSTWDELYQFSIRDVEKFTEEVLKFLDIKFNPPYGELLDTSNGVEFPEWFSTQRRKDAESEPGTVATGFFSHAGLNITEMCLDRWQTDEMKDQPAVIWEGEEGTDNGKRTLEFGGETVDYGQITWTYEELFEEVEECAEGLRLAGFSKGEAIGIHLPMMVETVVALLAIGRIGAIAVPVFSGYGVEAIASRLNAVGAKALFTCDHFPRRGKDFDAFSIAMAAVDNVPTVQNIFIVCRWKYDDLDRSDKRVIDYEDLLEKSFDSPDEKWNPEPTSAEDPLIILYTSGTTGKPKGIAHTHASFPIKAAQDMAFGTDVGKGTRICWYTDIGWMMGPWLIYGALINGATICIYDGAPDYPTPDRMWEFCARHKVEVLGISPTLVRGLAAHEATRAQATGAQASRLHEHEVRTSDDPSTMRGIKDSPPLRGDASETLALQSPFERHDLCALRILASTGEPWNPGPWWWLFEKVGNSKLPIINYSGGTEIAGGILMGNPLLPIKPCSFSAPCPGMDVDIVDENGQPVHPGEVGELVIKQPWIGMARGFWHEKERYLETYWNRFPGIWVHGDWAMRDEEGFWYILGRSDDTLKVAGKRVGPAEVESILVGHSAVAEAAVIGVPDETKGTAMVAFCVLTGAQASRLPEREGSASETLALQSELRSLVARDMGKPLAPSKIHFVSTLPKTRNAKVMRRVLRSAYLGEDPGDLSALENPQAVNEIRRMGK